MAGTEAGDEAIVAVGRTLTSKNLKSPSSSNCRTGHALRLGIVTRADREVISHGRTWRIQAGPTRWFRFIQRALPGILAVNCYVLAWSIASGTAEVESTAMGVVRH